MEANGSKVKPKLGWPPILAYPLKGKRELIRVRILGPLQFITKSQTQTGKSQSEEECSWVLGNGSVRLLAVCSR